MKSCECGCLKCYKRSEIDVLRGTSLGAWLVQQSDRSPSPPTLNHLSIYVPSWVNSDDLGIVGVCGVPNLKARSD